LLLPAGLVLQHLLSGIFLAGEVVGKLHRSGIVHGDLTTSNMIIHNRRCVLIDFGLSHVSSELESRGVDIHVFFQTLESTTSDYRELISAFVSGYKNTFDEGAQDVLERVNEIKMRGRYL